MPDRPASVPSRPGGVSRGPEHLGVDRAEAERLRDEGKHVVSIGWGDPDNGGSSNTSPNREPSNKD